MVTEEAYSRLYRNLEFLKVTVPRTYQKIERWAANRDRRGTPADAPLARMVRFILAPPNPEKIDIHTFRFIEATLNRARAAEIEFFKEPQETKPYYLVVFGLGKNVDPGALVDELGSQEVFVVEPDIARLWHSMETVDWVAFIEERRQRGGNIHFLLSDDPDIISGAIWRTIRATNPCITDGLMCLVHDGRPFVNDAIDNLKRQMRMTVSNLGFFYDETLMLWNTYRNLGSGSARIYRRSPEVERSLPVFVIGSGPSLDSDIPFLRQNQSRAVIVSCGSALRPLLTNEIRPDFRIEMENIEVSPERIVCSLPLVLGPLVLKE